MQLQAEIDRMAAKTLAPELLRELFDALDNYHELIAECSGTAAISRTV